MAVLASVGKREKERGEKGGRGRGKGWGQCRTKGSQGKERGMEKGE